VASTEVETFDRTPVSLGIVLELKTRRLRSAAATGIAAIALTIVMLIPAAPSEASDPDPFFGVVTQRKMDSNDYDLMRWGRFGSFRVSIEWHSINPVRGRALDWKIVDEAIMAAAKRDIEVLPSVYGVPSWIHRNWRTLPVSNSFQKQEWRRFLTAAVARYGADGDFWVQHPDLPYKPIKTWQIWNEPNIITFARPISPKSYGRLLRMSSRTITAVDPDAKIATAGFYATPPKGKGIDADRFLDRMYRVDGARESFDVAAIHPYAKSARESLQRTNPIRRVLDKHRNFNRPMIITELGWGSDSLTVFGKGSESAQASELKSAYRIFLNQRRRLRLEAIYWFSWSDLPADVRTCAFCFSTGFFDMHGDPKPAWFEVLNFTHDI